MTINAKTQFSILANGSDETTKIQQAIAAGNTGEDVYFAPGIYGHTSSLNGQNVFGAGRGATIFKRLANVSSFKFHGTNTDTRHVDGSLRNLTVHGNDYAAPLIDAMYASHLSIDNVKLFAAEGIALHMTEVWDSEVRNLYGNYIGGDTTSAVYINSARTASGFGSSNDNSNQIKFYNLHLEYVRGSGVQIDPGVGNNGPNGIWITDLKIESPISKDSLVKIGVNSNRVIINDAYLWVADTGTGQPIKAAIENNSAGSTRISNVFIGNANKRTLDYGVLMNTSSSPYGGVAILDNIEGYYGVKPIAHVKVLSKNDKASRTNIFSN